MALSPTPPGPPRPPAGPGKQANRQDLSRGNPGVQGVYTETGQPYGQATAERTALKAAPIPRADMFAPGGGGTPPAPAPGQANASAPPPMPQGPNPGMPSIHDLLNVATRNPQEPVTAGLPIGAGPGPAPTPSPAAQVLSYLASTHFATDQVRDLANRLSLGNVNY